MSQYLHVLCRSDKALTRLALEDFIREGVFFDEPPRFVLSGGDEEGTSLQWKSLEVYPPGIDRPIVILRYGPGEVLTSLIEELVGKLRESGLEEIQAVLIQRLRASQQIYLFEVDPSLMTEESWELLDATEAHVARECDGLLFVDSEGFYDAKLQPICRLLTTR